MKKVLLTLIAAGFVFGGATAMQSTSAHATWSKKNTASWSHKNSEWSQKWADHWERKRAWWANFWVHKNK